MDDVRAIGSALTRRIQDSGRIYLPPYGLSIPCKLVGGLRMEEPIEAIIEGEMPSAVMELCLIHVPVA